MHQSCVFLTVCFFFFFVKRRNRLYLRSLSATDELKNTLRSRSRYDTTVIFSPSKQTQSPQSRAWGKLVVYPRDRPTTKTTTDTAISHFPTGKEHPAAKRTETECPGFKRHRGRVEKKRRKRQNNNNNNDYKNITNNDKISLQRPNVVSLSSSVRICSRRQWLYYGQWFWRYDTLLLDRGFGGMIPCY